ncbi:MAG: Aspartyl-tRNA synthetase [Candidatus Peribacteria bacterium]|nr:Aspartyl-tRNA synthetase [Candidatus Peribacteria bacterium]
MRILSSELKYHTGKQVQVSGWLHKKRQLGKITFLILRDRHGLIQIVDETNESEKLRGLHNGTVLTVTGNVIGLEKAPSGAEIHHPVITVDVSVEHVSPIEVDKAIDHTPENLETLFENRVIGLRNVIERGIFKVQANVKQSVRDYLRSQDFTEFNSPKLLAGSTEGGAEVFKLDYFGKEATLAQSAQFYKQIMVGVFERVYEINPTYRAELSYTTRHMTEFMHIDVEMGFIEGLQDVLAIAGGILHVACTNAWKDHEEELLALGAVKPVLKQQLPIVSLKELHRLYTESTGQDTTKEKDPTPAEERWICEYSAKEWKSEAVFVSEFPAKDMKFYHYRNELNPDVADRADLLFRGVEIATLSRREHRYDKLVEQLKAVGGDPEHLGFKYYLMAFKYGLPAHGGFGMGLERLTQKIIGLHSVKEATLFPRDVNRLQP